MSEKQGLLLGRARYIPRLICSFSIPVRLTARREWGCPFSIVCVCVCRPLIFAFARSGLIVISIPTSRAPSNRVPVTTVPEPLIVKTRSIHNKGLPLSSLGGKLEIISLSDSLSVSMLYPVVADTGITGKLARVVSAICSSISCLTSSNHSSSTKSALVKATAPCLTP